MKRYVPLARFGSPDVLGKRFLEGGAGVPAALAVEKVSVMQPTSLSLRRFWQGPEKLPHPLMVEGADTGSKLKVFRLMVCWIRNCDAII